MGLSRLSLLPAADRRQEFWANGGGVTQTVAADPPGAAPASARWRVSIARVERPGPFSTFVGMDRILTILDGILQLSVGHQATDVLSRATGPHAFPGDVAAYGVPVSGAVTDLNVMVRRDAFVATCDVVRQAAIRGDSLAIVIATRPTVVRIDDETMSLLGQDALRFDHGPDTALCAADPVMLVTIAARQPSVGSVASPIRMTPSPAAVFV